MDSPAEPLLSVRNLTVGFRGPGGITPAVRGVSFDIRPGETLAIVGESGSGKSVTALFLLQLLPANAVGGGSVLFRGQELAGAHEEVLRGVRGNRISMVFQEPMTSLNPLHTVEAQVGEAVTLHRPLNRSALRARVLELLTLVGLPDAASRLTAYPHQLSGGQRQRVMIAMALANDPDLLIADEPTTALDVTIQAQILDLLRDLKRRSGMALLLITHDLGIVRRMADRVCVMKEGEVVEQAAVSTLFHAPAHPYTRRLLAASPTGTAPPPPADAAELLSLDGLKVWYPLRAGLFRRAAGHVRALDGVSLTLRAGHTLGIVGESGSGKTTLGQALLRLVDSRGGIRFADREIQGLGPSALRPLRRQMGIVFQDPYGSLSPRMTVGRIVGEGLRIHGIGRTAAEREAMVATALTEVGLDPGCIGRYPHEFSGGQRQRISIARALVLTPRLIVLDEPTSALDMSVQAQIIDLLRGLQARHGLSYLFISHDLKVVRAMAHDIAVMKDGVVVESGPADQVLTAPRADYTRALLAAAFDMEPADADPSVRLRP